MFDKDFLTQAIEQSKESISKGGFPAGILIVKDGKILAKSISIGNILHDPTSHGEIAGIREACKNLKTVDLKGVTIYSSMEPCMMCLAASMWASVSRIVFACSKSKVSAEYYGGNYKTLDINKAFLKPIEIIHMTELQDEAFKVVAEWEKSLVK